MAQTPQEQLAFFDDVDSDQQLPIVSKSKFLSGLKCAKLLWYQCHARDQLPSPDVSLQMLWRQGHEVGSVARQLFPNGIRLAPNPKPWRLHAKSLEALRARKPLFEAGMLYEGAFALADILVPVGKEQWDLIEVKSSTTIKADHLWDIAFQLFIFLGAGVNIRRSCIRYVNRAYIRQGDFDPKAFFVEEEVSKQIEPLLSEIKPRLEAMQAIIAKPQPPRKESGPRCFNPNTCPLRSVCWDFLPERSVFDLYHGQERAHELAEMGIYKLTDIPPQFSLTRRQNIQRQCELSNSHHIDANGIRHFLNSLKYPLYFFDLESFQTAIPLLNNTHPYEQIPFQFSLHVVPEKGDAPRHYAYLAENKRDPRQEFLARLEPLLGSSGSIVAYNSAFETARFKEAAQHYPEHRSWIKSAISRFVDLHRPFYNFHYYHPSQRGSTSIKSILPALTDRNYDRLAIADGHHASIEYMRMALTTVDDDEKKRLRQQLLDYCYEDTLAMVHIVAALEEKLREKEQQSA